MLNTYAITKEVFIKSNYKYNFSNHSNFKIHIAVLHEINKFAVVELSMCYFSSDFDNSIALITILKQIY